MKIITKDSESVIFLCVFLFPSYLGNNAVLAWLVFAILLVIAYAKIVCNLFCRFFRGYFEQLSYHICNISVLGAAKTIEMVVVQLHRRSSLIVKQTANHIITHINAVIIGYLTRTYILFYSFKQIQIS